MKPHLEIQRDVALTHAVSGAVAVAVASPLAPQHRVPVGLSALPRRLLFEVWPVVLQVLPAVRRGPEHLQHHQQAAEQGWRFQHSACKALRSTGASRPPHASACGLFATGASERPFWAPPAPRSTGACMGCITRAELSEAELVDDCTIEAASVPTRPLTSNHRPALLPTDLLR